MDNLTFQECCEAASADVALTEEELSELRKSTLPYDEEGDKEDLSPDDVSEVARIIVGNL